MNDAIYTFDTTIDNTPDAISLYVKTGKVSHLAYGIDELIAYRGFKGQRIVDEFYNVSLRHFDTDVAREVEREVQEILARRAAVQRVTPRARKQSA